MVTVSGVKPMVAVPGINTSRLFQGLTHGGSFTG